MEYSQYHAVPEFEVTKAQQKNVNISVSIANHRWQRIDQIQPHCSPECGPRRETRRICLPCHLQNIGVSISPAHGQILRDQHLASRVPHVSMISWHIKTPNSNEIICMYCVLWCPSIRVWWHELRHIFLQWGSDAATSSEEHLVLHEASVVPPSVFP